MKVVYNAVLWTRISFVWINRPKSCEQSFKSLFLHYATSGKSGFMTSPSKLGSRFDRAKVRMMPVQVQMIESLARKPAVTMRFSQNSQFLFAENRKKKDWLHLPDRKMWWNLESSFPFCDIVAASVVSISFQGYSFSALKFFVILKQKKN